MQLTPTELSAATEVLHRHGIEGDDANSSIHVICLAAGELTFSEFVDGLTKTAYTDEQFDSWASSWLGRDAIRAARALRAG